MSLPPSDLRPLALGEIVDRSATFWRQHFRSLLALSLGFNLLTYILSKVLQLTLRDSPLLLNPQASGDLGELGLATLQLLVTLGGVLLGSLWLYYFNTLVVARYVVPRQLGDAVRLGECLRRAFQRIGAFSGAYLLSLGWGIGALMLLCVPGGALAVLGGVLVARPDDASLRFAGLLVLGIGFILIGLGMLGALLWYLLRFALLGPVIALEDASAWKSFRRSGALLSGRVEPGFIGRMPVRAMILVTVVSVILIAVSLLCGLPALILQLVYRDPSNPMLSLAPQALLVPAELLQVVGQAVFNPLGLVVYATLYLDMRVRREGLDLERRLDALA
ncbi:hypothetical protein [Archangium primigenium]|uniref:hypothetical protein n=1 Tax=[Archangium] primigenium TaxID=2792470 RepID=UPI001959170B|nr:hypothetical protein [Archangium primigenium]